MKSVILRTLQYKGFVLNQRNCRQINIDAFIDAVCDSMRIWGVEENNNQSSSRYGENEVEELAKMFHLDSNSTRRDFVVYKMSGGRKEFNELKKLKIALQTLSASNSKCERGFSTMNNIITLHRNQITTSNASSSLFISQVGEPFQNWSPEKYVKTWLEKGRRSAFHVNCKKRVRPAVTDNDYYQPIWDVFKWKLLVLQLLGSELTL